jgi:hypothetical protein
MGYLTGELTGYIWSWNKRCVCLECLPMFYFINFCLLFFYRTSLSDSAFKLATNSDLSLLLTLKSMQSNVSPAFYKKYFEVHRLFQINWILYLTTKGPKYTYLFGTYKLQALAIKIHIVLDRAIPSNFYQFYAFSIRIRVMV